MAIFEQGILRGFSGKVGPVVGSTWKGKDVMKARPRKRKGGSSVKQIDQQLRFSAVTEFQAPFAELLDVTFRVMLRMSRHKTPLSLTTIRMFSLASHPIIVSITAKRLLAAGATQRR